MATDGIRRILVTGATGKQGGAVVKALLANPPPFDHEILALTRKVTSASAQKLSSNPKVKIIQGDLDNVGAVFESAGGPGAVWGVFSMQLPSMKKLKEGVVDKEVAQGCTLFDAALANGVKHFVYSSVDRGGNKSFENHTPIPHFITKCDVELHIRDKATATAASNMTWTILRPVAFMDNLQPNFFGRVFAAMWAQMEPKKLQLVAVRDIGTFAAQAFAHSEKEDYKNQAIGLAGDELSQKEAAEIFWQVKGRPMVQSYWFIASFIKWAIADLGIMFKWFEDEGYGVDIEKCKRLNPDMMDFKTYLAMESKFH
ncbi:hypothetical protein H2198_000358 [Neophaeococcomyces mojaviensis]|uniref:Uncharacterized protein n=1 Tax=Neophaeococcomyces mojaviensis TaxID=3383035 RepID=A0ACC3AKG2_9EURO|nr:hypothetical protein H2198_000358 [Knufia sp. JES_112]